MNTVTHSQRTSTHLSTLQAEVRAVIAATPLAIFLRAARLGSARAQHGVGLRASA